MARKRTRSEVTIDGDSHEISRKRPATATSPPDVENEESLESILARIEEQERSEALARQLNEEWNGSSSQVAESSNSNSQNEVITVDDDDDDQCSGDAALAQKLAQEWQDDSDVDMDIDEGSFPANNGPAWEDQSEIRTLDSEDEGGSFVATSKPSKSKSTPKISIPNVGINNPPGPSSSKDKSTVRTAPIAKQNQVPTAADQLVKYRQLFTASRGCTKCNGQVASPRGYVTYSPQVPPPSLLALLHATCNSCKAVHCRGCFKLVSCLPSCKALFEALGGFDRLYLNEQQTANTRAKEAAAKRRSTVGSVGPGGTGYGGRGSRGRGRGRGRGGYGENNNSASSGPSTMVGHFDELIVRALTTITMLLPSPYAENAQTYDMIPHGSISSLLLLSQLPEILGRLLRNDSITDWTARSDVYYAMLALLRRLADCELSIQVLISPRYEIKHSCGLEEWMWEDGSIDFEKSSDSDSLVQSPPLHTHFRKLTKQCEAFLAGASHMLQGVNEGEGGQDAETMVKATSLCGDIIAARDDIDRVLIVMGKDFNGSASTPGPSSTNSHSQDNGKGKGKGKNRDPLIALENAYAEAWEKSSFKYVILSQTNHSGTLDYSSFNYAQQLTSTQNATRNPKDRLHLIKELAVLATSLPMGIWMRLDEVRNDAIKVMIAGPEGTPYENGLFEFDLFIPLEYPIRPPLMHLRTTGQGRIRFNPNLYSNGKVCLSLLGTWAGRPEEMWAPYKSTLLQVLVSIQSMILVDMPWFNEPGRGQANPSSQASKTYNNEIAAQTTRWAIVEWLKDEHKNGIWADVIKSHFTLRAHKILQTLQLWSQSSNMHSYSLTSTNTGEVVELGPQHGRGGGTKMDLIQQFEIGVERVKRWELAGTQGDE
ncbi:hypothetical protein ABKN59_003427 [Abortiporus biennis]